jgi:hypothetical protein
MRIAAGYLRFAFTRIELNLRFAFTRHNSDYPFLSNTCADRETLGYYFDVSCHPSPCPPSAITNNRIFQPQQ